MPRLRLVPSWPVRDLAIYWMGRRGGFDPAQLNVEAAASRLPGHVKKALKFGASREEVSEAIAIGVNAAAIVDLTDIAADNMNLRLFPGPEKK